MEEKPEQEKKEEQEATLRNISDRTLFIAVGVIILLLLAIFELNLFMKPKAMTIDDLHNLNLQGKLKPEQGYMYNGYSFVNVDNFWYTQIKSPKGKFLYSLMFRFGPREVSDVLVEGSFDVTSFDSSSEYYVTFDPLGSDFTYVAAAVNDFNQNMLKVYDKKPIAACDKNETDACKTRPVITCSNTDKIVFYVNESEKNSVRLNNNCIVIGGKGPDLIKAVDRLLFLFYGIITQ